MVRGSDHGSNLTSVKGKGAVNRMDKTVPLITVGLTKIWPI